MPIPAIVNMRGLHKRYIMEGVEVHALRGINLRVEKGDFVAIMGASGSGKSTLMNIIGCLDLPDEGTFEFNGRNVTGYDADELATLRNKEIGFVFQGFNLLARTDALENVETPLIYAGVNKKDREQRAQQYLQQVGLRDHIHHLPNQLSGGQQQRVAIARALINRPALLLADEPTGNLDSKTSKDIMTLLKRLNEEDGLTIILITHEQEVADVAKRHLVMRDGQLENR
ncbi:MAG: ABC transporter ATP-binding protein [Gammaproteobacteria bacterium]|nr:ABC transporter ATP-binding protein [Gammaproteobacteria bacterium]